MGSENERNRRHWLVCVEAEWLLENAEEDDLHSEKLMAAEILKEVVE